jgi:hypothetical protein
MNTLKFNQIEFNHIGEQPSMRLQEKSITVKENGTIEIVPDSGYALEKVKVNVDSIPNIKYYKVTQELIEAYASWDLTSQESFFMVVDTYSGSMYGFNMVIIPRGQLDSFEYIIAFSVNFSKILSYGNPPKIGNMYGYANFFKIDNTIIYNILNTLPEITAEEYYNFK